MSSLDGRGAILTDRRGGTVCDGQGNLAIHGRSIAAPGTKFEQLYVAFPDAASGRRPERAAIAKRDGRSEMKNLRDVRYDLELDFAHRPAPRGRSGARPGSDDVELLLEERT